MAGVIGEEKIGGGDVFSREEPAGNENTNMNTNANTNKNTNANTNQFLFFRKDGRSHWRRRDWGR